MYIVTYLATMHLFIVCPTMPLGLNVGNAGRFNSVRNETCAGIVKNLTFGLIKCPPNCSPGTRGKEVWSMIMIS